MGFLKSYEQLSMQPVHHQKSTLYLINIFYADTALRALGLGDEVCITFYQDTEYISPSGRITGIDGINRLIFLSGRPIPIDDIASVSRCAVQNDR